MTHTTVTTQQFQTSTVSFVIFSWMLALLPRKLQSRLATWIGDLALSCGISSKVLILGAFTEGATTEGMVHSEI